MNRFRPRPRGHRFNLQPVLAGVCFWFVVVVAYLVWVGWPHPRVASDALNHAVTRLNTNLSVSYTGLSWHKRPIYYLRNPGPVLGHVNVYSWSEDELAVLYIGTTAPKNLGTKSALTNPPFSLAHNQGLWFVGESLLPRTFTVTWEDGGGVEFTTVHAASPATGA